MLMDALGALLEYGLVMFGIRTRDEEIVARVAEEKRRRLVEMAGDPVRRKYVERIERGAHWSDEDIAFNENPHATGVCPHLRTIERDMRASGIELKPVYPLRISANCLVDARKLGISQSDFANVAYLDVHIPDRSMLDPRSAMIVCRECHSTIDVVHPDVAAPDARWFPG